MLLSAKSPPSCPINFLMEKTEIKVQNHYAKYISAVTWKSRDRIFSKMDAVLDSN